MAYTLPGCLIGYVIVAPLFRKFFCVNLSWKRGVLIFIVGWILATIPGWISGKEAYKNIFQILWPVLSYSAIFFILHYFLKGQRSNTTKDQKDEKKDDVKS